MSKRITGLPHFTPRDPRDLKFCERWLEHFDHSRAYEEAGFKGTRQQNNARARKKLERFAPYLIPLQQAKAQVVAERAAVSQDDVLQAMGRVAFLNPRDYFVKTEFPVTKHKKVRILVPTEGHQIGDLVDTEIPVVVGGQVIYQVRAKQIDELTPEQLAAVEISHNKATGELSYRLPDQRVRLDNRKALGQNLGLFLEKVIYQNHQHLHQHAHLDVSAIPPAKQNDAIRALLPYVGTEFAQFLGFTMEEIANATEGELLEPQPGKAVTV